MPKFPLQFILKPCHVRPLSFKTLQWKVMNTSNIFVNKSIFFLFKTTCSLRIFSEAIHSPTKKNVQLTLYFKTPYLRSPLLRLFTFMKYWSFFPLFTNNQSLLFFKTLKYSNMLTIEPFFKDPPSKIPLF